MPYEFYRILHFLGILLVFGGLGGLAAVAAHPGTDADKKATRKPFIISHGIGLALLLVAGFGLLARIGGGALLPWVYPKIIIWLLLGAASVPLKRAPGMAKPLFFVFVALGLVSALFAVYKPFV